MINLETWIEDFLASTITQKDIYNEAGIQFKLAMFLEDKLKGTEYQLQLERNIEHFGVTPLKTQKKEMDLVVFKRSDENIFAHCIEIKYPHNGQVPAQMFLACKDISFLEYLTESPTFQSNYFLMLADSSFYEDSSKNDGIYAYYRRGAKISGEIVRPVNAKQLPPSISLRGTYTIDWKNVNLRDKHDRLLKYCLTAVTRQNYD